jgi:hypothetical protein
MPVGFARSLFGGSATSLSARASAATIAGFDPNGSFTTAYEKFGTYGLFTDTNGSTLNIAQFSIKPNASDVNFRFNSNFAFTVEFWLTTSSSNSFPQKNGVFSIGVHNAHLNDTVNDSGKGRVEVNGTTVRIYLQGGSDNAVALSEFSAEHKHLAYVSTGTGTQSWYYNGTRLETSSYTDTGSTLDAVLFGLSGSRNTSPATGRFVYDEFRISNTARYSGSTYTLPTTAFVNDSNTLALYHFENNTDDDIN